jgi:predicted dinucleotide-binding enzyme
MAGRRDPPKSKSLGSALRHHPSASGATIADAARQAAAVVILAVPCLHEDRQIEQLAARLGETVSGKIVVDVTNPFDRNCDARWRQGTSCAEVLQRALPGAGRVALAAPPPPPAAARPPPLVVDEDDRHRHL